MAAENGLAQLLFAQAAEYKACLAIGRSGIGEIQSMDSARH